MTEEIKEKTVSQVTMNNTNWDEFRCRCSGIHRIMSNKQGFAPLSEVQLKDMAELEEKQKTKGLTGPQQDKLNGFYAKREMSKQIILSDSCIEYLMEVYSWETTGKVPVRKEIGIEQLEKGKDVEKDSIILLSVVEDVFYEKNTERIHNNFLSGEPDIFIGDNIMNASKITDIKSCYDYPSFLKKVNVDAENGWKTQVQGYMDITGAEEGEIAHCLVNMTDMSRMDLKKKVFYKMGYATEEAPEFKEKWEVIERSMIFDDIPMHKRVFKIPVEPFTDFERQSVYDRVKVCREWLWKFDEMYQKMNIVTNELTTTK